VTPEDRDPSPVVETDEAGPRSSRSAPKKKHLPVWQETILLLGIALVLAIVIKALFVQAFYNPSESMEPGLVKNDRILVQKVSYWFGGSPQRGDVIVFKDPGDWLSDAEAAGPTSGITELLAKIGLYPAGGHLVKRVIGVEGDVIKCCDKQGRISVNGVALNEKSYVKLDGAPCYGPMTSTCDWTAGPVPEGHVFVMGDNRSHSADSTVHMCSPDETDCVPGDEFVATDLVVGKVFVLLWPRDHFRWIHRPATFEDVPDAS
jgi:signal peptidase I